VACGNGTSPITGCGSPDRAGLTYPNRPIGSFLFLGPTGVGKTELARALAESLFGGSERLVRLDMTESSEAHTVSRLVGAPPGYVGHNEPGQLTDAVRRTSYTVVLLDEVGKAHPDVVNVLLQVLEDGRLTDTRGRTVNFSNTVVIMTSNLGADAMLAATAAGRSVEDIREPIMAVARGHFRPEFLNRVDDVVLFKGLGREQLRAITELLLAQTPERLRAQRAGLRRRGLAGRSWLPAGVRRAPDASDHRSRAGAAAVPDVDRRRCGGWSAGGCHRGRRSAGADLGPG
jgi:ATP-dependent Clp protease ATP-binding subunit ClpC